ncbi:hypothetical protein MAAFP003_1716 [Mycobacterium ahvazicum]|uniref:Uncharacterized protein n=1 Tax=Mycobacterium ahvazicum TaxID=1964395 RepID=A0A2K4Y8B6_9MYCO|nr:hypothetical protein MAAFP003_1716 [Mycobacterium ahvazicum]
MVLAAGPLVDYLEHVLTFAGRGCGVKGLTPLTGRHASVALTDASHAGVTFAPVEGP